ncbi:YjbF family lipoprotein [Donghicola sp. XS_ASV15]|uniref:YjbF family lipoprotein n=1 Tax=Donghicola sp. XS_ASV15 TaxID=3241295 RepID=UPI00351948B2
MKRGTRLIVTAVLGLGVLSACGTTGRQESRRELFELAFTTLKQNVTGAKDESPSISDIRALAPTVLEAVPLPIILVSRRKTDEADFYALSAETGDYRIYASSDDVTITLQGGVLAETRRLGSDLMSSQNGPLPKLLKRRASGDYQRVLRTLDAEGHEISVMYDCRLSAGDAEQMTENCTTPGKAFRNIYEYVPGSNMLLRSEQWLNDTNGHLTIEHLRH